MIIIRVKLFVESHKVPEFLRLMTTVVEANKDTINCHTFCLNRDIAAENAFLLYEEWEDLASFNTYKQSESFSKTMTTVAPMLLSAPDSVYYEATTIQS